MQERWRGWFKAKDGQVASWVLAVLIVGALALAYSNTLHGPFIYDDFNDITGNPSIRHLSPLRDVFYLKGHGFSTRPITNLSFAINYALGGLNTYTYHLTNLGIHILASLFLLGFVRRTLALPRLRTRYGRHAATLSLLIAALWALHPLQTESVSYLTQRYESLAGLFVFATLYCAVRTADASISTLWSILGSISCLLALGSKEVAVSLPIIVLLFDRTFLAGSFSEAWKSRRALYLGLLAAWVGFAFIQGHPVQRTFAGFGLDVPWWRYALNQPAVILHYLRLSLWPHPLVFDYFWRATRHWHSLLPGLVLIGGMVVTTIWGLVKNTTWAIPSAFFFLILAPTSSVMPILDLAVEHRMYLPLGAVVILVVLKGFDLLIWLNGRRKGLEGVLRTVTLLLVSGTLAGAGVMTYMRNEEYQASLDLWRDTLRRAPNNPRAEHNYAYHLAEVGLFSEAAEHYQKAIDMAPNVPLFRSNFGVLLGKMGRFDDSLKHLRLAIQLDPDNAGFILNLGTTLLRKGSLENAETCFETASNLNPTNSMPYANLAAVAMTRGQFDKASDLLARAIQLDSWFPGFYLQQGEILHAQGNEEEARKAYLSLIRLEGSPALLSDVSLTLRELGAEVEAMLALRKSLSLDPRNTRSQLRLARLLSSSPVDSVRNGQEAMHLMESVLRTQPIRTPELLDLYSTCLAESGRYAEATTMAKEALSLSRNAKEEWVAALEKRIALFENGKPFRERPKGSLIPKVAPPGLARS